MALEQIQRLARLVSEYRKALRRVASLPRRVFSAARPHS